MTKKQPNELRMSKSAYKSPYMQSMAAARMAKPNAKSVKMRPVGIPSAAPGAFGAPGMFDYGFDTGAAMGYAEIKEEKPKRARRLVPVLLIALFTLLFIAVLGLGYANLDMLSDYNSYLALYEGNPDAEDIVLDDTEGIEEGAENGGETEAEAAAQSEEETDGDTASDEAQEDETAGETAEGDAEEDIEAPALVSVGVEDLFMSFAAMFVDSIDGSGYYMYTEFYQNIDSADTVTMIASYVLPVALLIAAVTALVFFIRALVAMFGAKRRKGFIASAVVMLVFTLISAVAGYLMVAGTDFSLVMSFLTMDGTLALQLGMGTIILAALSLVTLIMSFFAFRKSRKLS